MKKLDCRFTDAGDGGILDIVSIVRSDSDGRICRTRPRVSWPSSSPLTTLASSSVLVSSESPLVSLGIGCVCSLGFAGDE